MPSSQTPAAVHSPSQPRTGVQIAIMAIAAFVIVTTEFLIIGLLPALARDLAISVTLAGQLVTLFAFTVMLFGPILTARLAHIDRRKLFTFIVLVFAASNALAAVSVNIWVMAIARFIPALLLPVFWGTASETAGQLAGPAHAGKAIANVYMGISAALVFGIPLGTLAADAVGWRGSFWILAALCLLIAGLMLTCMPTLPSAPQRTTADKQTQILKDPRFIGHVALSILTFTAMFTAYTYLADTLESLAGIAPRHVGWWLMGFGAVGMLGNHIGGRLVDRSPLGSSVLFLTLLAAGMLAATPLASQYTGLIVALVVWGIAYTALFPICQVRVMRAGAKAQALAASLNISAANAGIGLGAIVGGLGIQHYGLQSLGMISAGIAATAIGLALLLMRRS